MQLQNTKNQQQVTNLTIVQRLKACYHSNNNCRFTFNAILMFQSPKSCLARCLAHHNFFWILPHQNVMHTQEKVPMECDNEGIKLIKDQNQLELQKHNNTVGTNTRLYLPSQSFTQFYTYLKKLSNSACLPWQQLRIKNQTPKVTK